MTTWKKLILITVLYLLISITATGAYQLYHSEIWLQGYLRSVYLIWAFFGPLQAVEYGWQGLAPIWMHLWGFLAGGLIIIPFLSLPFLFKGRIAARLCALGLVFWVALGASLFGGTGLDAQIGRLIAFATDLP